MNYVGATEKRNERRQEILEAIKNGTFDRDAIAEKYGIAKISVRDDLNFLRVRHPQIKNTGRGPCSRWYWEEDSKTKEEEVVERYPDHKNDEGYNDFTAAPTLKSMDDIYGAFEPGDVWSVTTAYGPEVEFLVLRSYKGWVTGLMLCDNMAEYNPVHCVCVNLINKQFVDCRRIQTKPSKYFVEKKFDTINFAAVKRKLSFLLCIEPEVKEVEKVVEKKVEVPVEVIKEVEKVVEVPIDKGVDAVDFALAKKEADIYKSIFWALINLQKPSALKEVM